MKYFRSGIIAILFCFCFVKIKAQLNTITTAVPFLMIAPDSRAGALGETGVATSPDANSGHWNGAKYAFADKKFGVSGSYDPWLRALVPDINLGYLSLYGKPDSVSAIFGSARYFSMGNIVFTNATGNIIGQSKPYEFAIDIGYSRRIARYWSLGAAARYIYSDITNGIIINGKRLYAGTSAAFDLSAYYLDRDRVKILNQPCVMMMGASLTNVGSKIKYSDSARGDFIPINLRVGQGFEFDFGKGNKFSFNYEFNKLLVPTPPIYEIDSNGNVLPVILAGKDPDVSVVQGMIQSFNDAPGGRSEELAEINFGIGAEYFYQNIFAVRMGYFYEAPTKGNRQFVSLGAGVKFNFISLDFAYLIPVNNQRSPLQNTLRFSLLFQFDRIRARKQ
ncbi:type IX secretion system outer membrane channel protein PorV [soil metagenome]